MITFDLDAPIMLPHRVGVQWNTLREPQGDITSQGDIGWRTSLNHPSRASGWHCASGWHRGINWKFIYCLPSFLAHGCNPVRGGISVENTRSPTIARNPVGVILFLPGYHHFGQSNKYFSSCSMSNSFSNSRYSSRNVFFLWRCSWFSM